MARNWKSALRNRTAKPVLASKVITVIVAALGTVSALTGTIFVGRLGFLKGKEGATGAESAPLSRRQDDLDRELKSMEASVAEARRQAQLSVELAAKIANAKPANAEVARLMVEVDSLRSEVEELTDAVGLTPEKALAVPLLSKDMDNLREGYRHDLDATQSEMNRVYDMNKWFLSTVVTMALALVGLAISNFLQLRKK